MLPSPSVYSLQYFACDSIINGNLKNVNNSFRIHCQFFALRTETGVNWSWHDGELIDISGGWFSEVAGVVGETRIRKLFVKIKVYLIWQPLAPPGFHWLLLALPGSPLAVFELGFLFFIRHSANKPILYTYIRGGVYTSMDIEKHGLQIFIEMKKNMKLRKHDGVHPLW